jgi:hypothetical protein
MRNRTYRAALATVRLLATACADDALLLKPSRVSALLQETMVVVDEDCRAP